MRIRDFKTHDATTFRSVECRQTVPGAFYLGEGRLTTEGDGSFRYTAERCSFAFRLCNDSDGALLRDYLNRHYHGVISVEQQATREGWFFADIVLFHSLRRIGKAELVVPASVVKKLVNRKMVEEGSNIYSQIEQNFMFSDGVSQCFAFTTDTAYSAEGEDVPNPEENSEEMKQSVSRLDRKSIRIYGRDYSFLISFEGTAGCEMLVVESVSFSKRNVPPMQLALGELKFTAQASYVSARIRQILEDRPGYLDLWNKYAELEGEYLLKRAREVGLIHFNPKNYNIDGEHLVVNLTEDQPHLKKYLIKGDCLCASEEVPPYLEDPKMTWKEYSALRSWSGTRNIEIIAFDPNGTLTIDAQMSELSKYPYLSLAIHGDKKQIDRRERARQLIASGRSANPALAFIIEGSYPDGISAFHKERKIEPLSPYVRKKIFKNEPTSTQREAISIALNTPDIAIIQGPPGTGKTTVITAILERLNEMADKRQINNGQVLITSFQHDAVRNVIERLSINSLPTIKYGRKQSDDITAEQAVEEWCNHITERLREKNPAIDTSGIEKELSRRYQFYLLSPCDSNALEFLRYAQSIQYDKDLHEDIKSIIDDISMEEDVTSGDLLAYVRRLRTTEAGFLDDGPNTADDLLERIEDVVDRRSDENRVVIDTLEEAASHQGQSVSKDFLCRMRDVKNLLLEKCAPRPAYAIGTIREDVADIYARVRKLIQRPSSREDEILYGLYYELSHNYMAVVNAVTNYNFAFASTTQQSDGADIKKAKGLGKQEYPTYNTVIVDEAARVSPGDLMIPLAQAERRIILVGDHRQLPHIYDEEIVEALQEKGDVKNQEDVGITLFQHLMKNAKKLYEIDHIPRTITLDAQYRMHPMLGKFVSDNFYQPYGEGFTSPLPPEHFRQDLYHKPLKWVDLPYSMGDETKQGTSRSRVCEADYIVREIRRAMNTAEGKHLSYGVITFYSAQVNLIRNKLGDLRHKVRVGSVDAFQGMEFDVIFLSVVRTQRNVPGWLDMDTFLHGTSKEAADLVQTTGQKSYGFLVSENRLCVSLSRQKKLLIVVGDGNLFYGRDWGPIAKKCVPAMYNLYELCLKEGVVEHA